MGYIICDWTESRVHSRCTLTWPLVHLLWSPPHNLYTFFTNVSQVSGIMYFFVVDVSKTEDKTNNLLSVCIIINQKFWVLYYYIKNRKRYQSDNREPIYRWNPCFIRITILWYPKYLEATFMPKHFLYYQQNKFEEFHLHWCFVWEIIRWLERFTAVVD